MYGINSSERNRLTVMYLSEWRAFKFKLSMRPCKLYIWLRLIAKLDCLEYRVWLYAWQYNAWLYSATQEQPVTITVKNTACLKEQVGLQFVCWVPIGIIRALLLAWSHWLIRLLEISTTHVCIMISSIVIWVFLLIALYNSITRMTFHWDGQNVFLSAWCRVNSAKCSTVKDQVWIDESYHES